LLARRISVIVAVGGVLGLILAAGLLQVERGRLGPIISLDAGVILSTAVGLVIAAGLAVLMPALRATRAAPATLLR
jgi:hypothetical protein